MMDFLAHIVPGDRFGGVYMVESASERNASNGGKYLEVFLRDKTGVRKVLCFRDYPTTLQQGVFVDATGKCGTYHDAPSLIIDTIAECETPADLSNYMPAFSQELLQLNWDFLNEELNAILAYSEEVKDFRPVALAVKEIFSNKLLQRDKFKVPAGTKAHYGKVGGFLMFTHDIYGLACSFIATYGLTDSEGMFLKCASLVCRCGCVFAYSFLNGLPSLTYQGEMLGEAALTTMLLNKAVQSAKAIVAEEGGTYTESTVSRFLHDVLAFHGLVPAKTREAIALHSIGSAHMASVDCLDFIESDTSTGKFTAFSTQHGRRFLKEC